MSDMTTYQAFEQFITEITITEYQRTSFIPARRDAVVQNLTATFPASSDMPFHEARLIGSAAKGTIIRPVDDIDVLAVFSNVSDAWRKYWYNSQAFLYRIRDAYNGMSIAQVGARGQAIRVFFQTGGHIDVAPVFVQSTDVYHLPNGTGGWLLTSPSIANKWFADKNAGLGYNLPPLVRMLKKWNGAHSTRLKSFHLETMAAATFSSLGSNKRTSLQKFFEWASSYLDVSDPGGQSGSLSGYLTWTARQQVINSFDAACDRANRALEAENDGDHNEAKRLWRIVLGDSFPT